MRTAIFLIPLLVITLLGTGCQSASRLPNIVVIMADDMGYGDVGVYNVESRIPTPHMDRLAQAGMRFTDAHAPSSVCTPTRYALLTGRYAWRTPPLERGVTRGYDPLIIDTTRQTIASMLKSAGYRTAVIGKWHLGLGSEKPTDYFRPLAPGPRSLGFDYYYGIPASLDMPPYVWVENESVVEAPTDSTQDTMPCCIGAFWRGGAMAPDFDHAAVLPVITEKAIQYIQEHAAAAHGQPMFLYVPLAAPHTPWLPSEDYQGASQAGEYGDFTVQVDAAVGAMADALDQSGIGENTLLIVMSDNGAYWRPQEIAQYDHRANHHWRGMKGDIHEGGHRVPFIARWPERIAVGSVTNQLTTHTDLLATFAAVARTSPATGTAEDSHNLLPVLRGGEPFERAAVHHSSEGMVAIRQGPWKLIEGQGSGGFTPVAVAPEDPQGQLYHLGEDPGEARNLYLDEPDHTARLHAILASIRDRGSL